MSLMIVVQELYIAHLDSVLMITGSQSRPRSFKPMIHPCPSMKMDDSGTSSLILKAFRSKMPIKISVNISKIQVNQFPINLDRLIIDT